MPKIGNCRFHRHIRRVGDCHDDRPIGRQRRRERTGGGRGLASQFRLTLNARRNFLLRQNRDHRIAAGQFQNRLAGLTQNKNRRPDRQPGINQILMAVAGQAVDLVAASRRDALQDQIVLDIADDRRAGRVEMPGEAAADHRIHRHLLGELRDGIHMLIDKRVRGNSEGTGPGQRHRRNAGQQGQTQNKSMMTMHDFTSFKNYDITYQCKNRAKRMNKRKYW